MTKEEFINRAKQAHKIVIYYVTKDSFDFIPLKDEYDIEEIDEKEGIIRYIWKNIFGTPRIGKARYERFYNLEASTSDNTTEASYCFDDDLVLQINKYEQKYPNGKVRVGHSMIN